MKDHPKSYLPFAVTRVQTRNRLGRIACAVCTGALLLSILYLGYRPSLALPILQQCALERDMGIIPMLTASAQAHCTASIGGLAPSSYTFYNSRGAQIQATHWQNLQLNLESIQVHQPIASIADDGGTHDPRYKYKPDIAICNCDSPQLTSSSLLDAAAPPVWDNILVTKKFSGDLYACMQSPPQIKDLSIDSTGVHQKVVTSFDKKTLVFGRRDDHNPFFQISAVLNAWIMLQALHWSSNDTRVMFLDEGFPSPVDQLYKAILSPNHPIVRGADVKGQIIHFDHVLIAPYEESGPMMRHLNDDEPCHDNQLISAFRSHALEMLGVQDRKPKEDSCILTVITRRPYSGRTVQRVWRNEDEILEHMRRTYPSVATLDGKKMECEFRSVEFVGMDMKEQMQTIVESDFVIGMHGAGMVNVMWARPGVPVLEIFPHERRRWGYRNLCQFTGCKWREFRGGKDIPTGSGPNSNDKDISKDEWDDMFKPMFEEMERQL